MEKLVTSAIKFYTIDNEYPIIMTGKRHADILYAMGKSNIQYLKSRSVQGFLTDTDRFVDRYEAKRIAIAANQLIVPEKDTYAELFSEDVW